MTVDEMRVRWNRVAELTHRGVPAELIAEQLGISVTHVFRIRAKQRGSTQVRRAFTAEEIVVIEEMLDDGCSYAEIGRTIGRHPKSIRRRWPGRGWDRSSTGQYAVLRQRVQQRLPGL